MATTTPRTPDINATIAGAMLSLSFSDGRVLDLSLGRLSDDIVRQATLHGLKQKLVDAAAISRNPDTGRTASIDDKYNAVHEVYTRLLAGQWNKPRGEGGTGSGGLLFRALCILYPNRTPEAIREFLDKKTTEEQTALRRSTKIADIIETLRKKDGPPVDEATLFDGLED